MRLMTAALGMSILLGVSSAHGQAPYLVKDLNTAVDPAIGSDPRNLRSAATVTYFVASRGTAYRGFWKTGGSAATTSLILDALDGVEPQVAAIGDVGLFSFLDSAAGFELWRTDGTAAGTTLVRDINPGPGHSSPSQLTSAGGLVYFLADDGTGPALWRSDGTSGGTIPLVAGQASALRAAGNLLYFVKSVPATGSELWRSDGTVGGTIMLADACPGTCSSSPQRLTPVGSTLYYDATDPVHGRELWHTDGTPGNTALVADLAPDVLSPIFHSMAAAGSVLVFATGSPEALWRTDGTAAGTEIIASANAMDLTSVGTSVFFHASTPVAGHELWHTDGTAAGTAMVGDLCPGPCDFFEGSSPVFFGSPQFLFFFRYNGTNFDAWRSDGTAPGTFLVKTTVHVNQAPAVLGNAVLFAADTTTSGRELWTSDGTVAGTVPITENSYNASAPTRGVIAGDRLFFEAQGTTGGRDLWVTQGTEPTTVSLDVAPGPAQAFMLSPSALGAALLTDVQVTPSPTFGLWTSDGTPAGTTFLRPMANLATPSAPGDHALLLADPTGNGSFGELWRSDGTVAGTGLVKELAPIGFLNRGRFLPALGDAAFLSVGPETGLWRSDGTSDGTVRVSSIEPTEGASLGGALILVVDGALWRSAGWPESTALLTAVPGSPRFLKAAAGRVFFTALSAADGRELWATDGTAAGTAMVKDIVAGPGGAFSELATINPFVELNGRVYFFAQDETHGLELWRSDGTAAGTVLLGETMPGLNSGVMGGAPTVAGGLLWFLGYSIAEGTELWSTDGTAAPALAADVAPGPYSSSPVALGTDGRRFYFGADDGTHGGEPWAIDLPPSLSVGDVTVVEGDGTPNVASFAVRLSSPPSATTTVAYATEDGSAHAGTDYQPRSGVLTFTPGPAQVLQVDVPLVGDLQEEAGETFVLRLSAPSQAVLADGEAIAFVQDDDAPEMTVQGVTVVEGNAPTTPAVVGVSLVTKDGAPTTVPKTVDFATRPGTATAGTDFIPVDGTLTFAAGTASGAAVPVAVSVVGDAIGEPDEQFQVVVVATSALQPASVAGTVVIADDDRTAAEIAHGSGLRDAFDFTGARNYRLLQTPYSSYEVRVDETSGSVDPVSLDQLVGGGTAVLRSGVADGTGTSVVLRWENATSAAIGNQPLRVWSAACGTGCGSDDRFRVRAYDTTLAGARFNNAGSQRTLVVLHNHSAQTVQTHIAYWGADGTLLAMPSVNLQPRETRVLDTAQDVPGQNGALTVSHTAGYGGIAGKAVTVEPATGFSFDTPLTSRPR